MTKRVNPEKVGNLPQYQRRVRNKLATTCKNVSETRRNREPPEYLVEETSFAGLLKPLRLITMT